MTETLTTAPVKLRADNRKPYRVHVVRSDNSVARLPWTEAYELYSKGKAQFLSNTLFKAAKAGLDIKKLRGQPDRAIKDQIKARRKPQEKKLEQA